MELYNSVRDGDVERCRRYLEIGINPNYQNRDWGDWSPLFVATYTNDYQCMELLLQYGANCNIKTKMGFSPLHRAVINANKRSIQILLSYGADTNIKDNDGDTPLDLALRTNDQSIIELFEYLPIKEPGCE